MKMSRRKKYVVLNKRYGGYGLSVKACEMLQEMGHKKDIDLTKKYSTYEFNRDIPRHHPDLVKVVKTLGERANGEYAELALVECMECTRSTSTMDMSHS